MPTPARNAPTSATTPAREDAAGADFPRPLTTVDVVILTVRGGALQVLLVQRPDQAGEPYPGRWALPGGFVDIARDADLQGCALRKLAEKTGVASPYLEQVGSWGGATRDPRGWSATHVYVALLADASLAPHKGGNAADLRWAPVEGDGVAVPLAFDHAVLLGAALARVRGKTEYTSLPAHLLPAAFTLGELQQVYETVLGRALEKKAFRTRMLAADLLEDLGEQKETGRRPASLYKLREQAGLVYFTRSFEQR
ncbi:NUDIX domain-containing protein [Cupriavidus sp. 2TAF22]|uniref:NUDIX hydrolase n=1 Tax=unclassified Cupriavidus TaxID=2640874 RepID=UPI003F8E36BC